MTGRQVDEDAADGLRTVAGNSVTVASWTLVSRTTGFLRAAVVAAVLGPTYLGNIFQTTNTLPNLTFEFLTGSLFATLLVPVLVRSVDLGDRRTARRVANGFLGITTLGFVVVAVVGVLVAPLLLHLVTSGVADPGAAAEQRRVGLLLMVLLMPQVAFYGLAATAAAVQNAHGRFLLAAAAPSLENVGMIVTLVVLDLLHAGPLDLATVTTADLVLLGCGTTASVVLHAAVQWVGARRVGVVLVPGASWRDPEVRELLRRLRPSLGYAGLNTARVFAVLVVANRIPGGVVAFTLALNFLHLPPAVFARPVAVALLPRLARLHHVGSTENFRDEAVRGGALALMPVIPAAVALAALAFPLAAAVAFGQMATPEARTALAVSTAALALGVIGEAAFIVATHASYALGDARAPFRAMISRTVLSLAVMAVAFWWLDGVWVLLALGAAISLGNVVSAAQLARSVLRRVPTAGARIWPPMVRALLGSAAMVGPAYAAAVAGPRVLPGRPGEIAGMACAVLLGAAIHVLVLRAMKAPELAVLLPRGSRRRRRGRGATDP